MKGIGAAALQQWMGESDAPLLIDVREDFEHEAFNIGGELMPMSELMMHVQRIPRDRPVVLYCEKGIRSVIAIQRLEALGFGNLYNLEGGMKAWREGLMG
jgi:rhodanese-related sulfurtransferase